MLKIRREVDGQLATYRRKMKAEQLPWSKAIHAETALGGIWNPRLSLFYLM